MKTKDKHHTWITFSAIKSNKRCAKCGIYKLMKYDKGKGGSHHYYSTDGNDNIGTTYDCK